ncbi:hypothetical protein HK102_008118, partial [Quaeritorhiza haematococci]
SSLEPNPDNECKVLRVADTTGGLQEQWFLTEDGIYELLSVTKKPLGKQFPKWVRQVMKEIRRTGEYRLKEDNDRLVLAREELEQQTCLLEQQAAETRLQLEQQTRALQAELQAKEEELQKHLNKTNEEIETVGFVYLIKTDGGFKVGRTKNIDQRVGGLQTSNAHDVEVMLRFPTRISRPVSP